MRSRVWPENHDGSIFKYKLLFTTIALFLAYLFYLDTKSPIGAE